MYHEANKEGFNEKSRLYREANKEEIAEYNRVYREANKEESRLHREGNKEALTEYSRVYREANKEEIAEKNRLYREANKEEIAEKKRLYYEAKREEYFVEHGCYPPISGNNDTLYIWEAVGEMWNDQPIFKIGVTSERLGDVRIHQVGRQLECEVKVHLLLLIFNEKATDLEARIHNMLPTVPNMGDIDGKTEFRACSYPEMEAIVEMIEFDEG